jgi:phytoene synthase
VTRSLHEVAGSRDWSLLHEALAGADLDLSCLTYATDAELGAYLYRSCGALHILAASLAAPEAGPADVRQFGSATGRLVRTAEILRDIGRDARAGRVFVPLERLERHRIDVVALQARLLGEPARACLRELARNARSDWDTAKQSTPPALRQAATGQRVLAGLHLALLDELERRDFDVGETRYEVQPWRRLWSGWRSARA